MRPPGERLERPLTLRGGGWVLLAALGLSVVLVIWATLGVFVRPDRSPGDGRTIQSYGFDLAALTVPAGKIRPAMPRRDMVQPIDEPVVLDGAEEAEIQPRRGKYLVPSDSVIGVVIDGEPRAYPITVMNVHEVVHDTLAGVPIAVTYSWPAASVAVFDRRVGDDVLAFGISGLLLNSSLLMYDRSAAPGQESLWAQIPGVAVSGPHAGQTLDLIPSVLVSWEQWLTLHPQTTVIGRDPSVLRRRYNKADPDLYFQGVLPLQPVEPAPPRDTPPVMTPVVVVTAGGGRRVYPMPLIAGRVDDEGVWEDELGGVPITFWYSPDAETVYVKGGDARHALWFAWYAFHPEDELAR